MEKTLDYLPHAVVQAAAASVVKGAFKSVGDIEEWVTGNQGRAGVKMPATSLPAMFPPRFSLPLCLFTYH
ncbi:hypothetical protein E2562_030720 [Oryza meyeriana var. granulata]|uniref:Uncharacterized protein n=1 Tax=Oryza meyeriana var. granulata TaxID=110450 RepID=A0A6G1CVU3_9ORYZ|nr:hypothetical protein E2562_030720 [Oryza meyeriana var. granulata]